MFRAPFERLHRPDRRLVRFTVGISIAAHALLVILLLLVPRRDVPEDTTMIVPVEPAGFEFAVPVASPVPLPAAPAGGPAASRAERRDETGPGLVLPVPATSTATASGRTTSGATTPSRFPTAGVLGLHASVVPLVATPYGIGRRPVVRNEARIARMRAESLVNARIASVVEAQKPVQAGPVSLNPGGGVSVPVPWGGFIRDDRTDDSWREKRCSGDEKDGGDDAGEEEARRTQCG